MTHLEQLQPILDARHIVVVQADNPDGDSLASALALEELLGNAGKQISLYCGVAIPTYLHHIPGWDRVENELPIQFDAAIIVDASAASLFDSLGDAQLKRLRSSANVALDHHQQADTPKVVDNVIVEEVVATGQLIYHIAKELSWEVTPAAARLLATSILSDSLGLTTEATDASSVYTLAELVEKGANLAQIDAARRELMKRSQEITAYKGQLLQRIDYADDGQVALVTIPWDEIREFSHQYNPSMLVIEDMRMVEGVKVALAFKTYPDGKVTCKIRCNYGTGIAHLLAEQFGGGGHPYAAGFKVTSGQTITEIKQAALAALALLLRKETMNETV